jgi:hypothetical protein
MIGCEGITERTNLLGVRLELAFMNVEDFHVLSLITRNVHLDCKKQYSGAVPATRRKRGRTVDLTN